MTFQNVLKTDKKLHAKLISSETLKGFERTGYGHLDAADRLFRRYDQSGCDIYRIRAEDFSISVSSRGVRADEKVENAGVYFLEKLRALNREYRKA